MVVFTGPDQALERKNPGFWPGFFFWISSFYCTFIFPGALLMA
jgi:hypothetical protein